MSSPIKVSIVITAYNNRGILRQLLRGLRQFPPRSTHEIIVVDNNSSDGTSSLVREFPHVAFHVLPQNLGLSYGNNEGIRKSSGEYILILNPDIAVFEGQIDSLLAFADSHEKAGIVAPKLLHPDKSLQLSTFRFPAWYTPILRRTPLGSLPWAKKHLQSYLMKDWDHNDSRVINWALGAALLVRRSALDRFGLQDESFFLYYEDVDWCRRCWEAGMEVWYDHTSYFIHYHKRESADSPGLKGIVSPITKIHIHSWLLYTKKYR